MKELFGKAEITEDFKKKTTWPKGLKAKAAIRVKAEQDALSGARMDCVVNGALVGSLHWHGFKTHQQVLTAEINLQNGTNVIDISYKVSAYGHGESRIKILSIFIDAEIDGPAGTSIDVKPTVVVSTAESIVSGASTIINDLKLLAALGVGAFVLYRYTKSKL